MKKNLKQNRETRMKLALVKHSRPRPEIRLRPAVFEDRSKYKRSRERASFRRELAQ